MSPPGPLFAVFAFGARAAPPAEPRDIPVALGVGLQHGYWAAVAAVVPMAASGTEGRLLRAWHRRWGTAARLLLAVAGPVLPLLWDRAVTTVLGVAVGVRTVLAVHDRRIDAPD